MAKRKNTKSVTTPSANRDYSKSFLLYLDLLSNSDCLPSISKSHTHHIPIPISPIHLLLSYVLSKAMTQSTSIGTAS